MQETATKNKKSRNRIAAVVAAMLVIALLLSGTYMLTDFAQHATNPFKGGEKVSVTLNDRFDPPTDWKAGQTVDKKVSATAMNDNTGNVYVRLQLKEYMERYKLVPVTDGSGNNILFATYADGAKKGQYMTWADAQAGGYDYTEYAVNGVSYARTTNDELRNGIYGKAMYITSNLEVYGTAPKAPYTHNEQHTDECDYNVHKWDTCGIENQSVTGDDIHDYISWALGGDVMTMTKWLDEDMPMGNFWVLDEEDGWVYWANALAPGQSTSNILESITLTQMPGAEFEYYIHIDMEAVSLDKLDELKNNGASTNGEILIDKLKQPVVSGFTVSASGAVTQAATSSSFTINLMRNASAEQVIILTGNVTGINLSNTPGLTSWTKDNANADWGAASSDAETYTITIPAGEIGSMTVMAKAKDDPSKTLTVTITVEDYTLFYSEGNMTYGSTTEDATNTLATTTTIHLTSPVGAATTRHFTASSTVAAANWVLDAGTTGATLTQVTANKAYGVTFPEGASGTATLTVGSYIITFNIGTVGATGSISVGETFTESGIEWRILAKNGEALIIAEHVQFTSQVHNSKTNWDTTINWAGSNLRKALNGTTGLTNMTNADTWYAGLDSSFVSRIVPTDLKTKIGLDGSGGYDASVTGQTFFLLSEDEVFGTSTGGDASNNLYAGTTLFADANSRKAVAVSGVSASYCWLRSPYWYHENAAEVDMRNGDYTLLLPTIGPASSTAVTSQRGVRPACVINLS